jgi:PKHD-type hydroxylase
MLGEPDAGPAAQESACHPGGDAPRTVGEMAEPLAVRPQIPRPTSPPYQPVQVFTGVFTPRQCERIIRIGSSLPDDEAGLEGEGGAFSSDSTLRRSRTSWISPGPDADWIFAKLAAMAVRANRGYGFDLSGFDEDLQFTTYDAAGAFYTWHQDGLDATVAVRKLSLVVQLSDPSDYEGAAVQFFGTYDGPAEVAATERHAPDAVAEPSSGRGSVLVFPSFEFHRVTPLRSGVRHSLVSWVSGPPFR